MEVTEDNIMIFCKIISAIFSIIFILTINILPDPSDLTYFFVFPVILWIFGCLFISFGIIIKFTTIYTLTTLLNTTII